MSTSWRFVAVMIVAAGCLLAASPAPGLILIEGNQNGPSAIEVKTTSEDDPNDTDQAYQASGNVIIQVNNGSRRYVAAVIDRILAGEGTTRVNNGPNDELIGPAKKLFSGETLLEYLSYLFYDDQWHPTLGSRRYILPLPLSPEPGTEIRFRVKVLGPAMGKAFPFPMSGEDVPPELYQMNEAIAWTAFELLFLDFLKTFIGHLPETKELQLLAEDFVTLFQTAETSVIPAIEKGDVSGFLRAILNFTARSKVLRDFLEKIEAKGAANALGALQDYLLSPLRVGEVFNVLVHLYTCNWVEPYDVWVVIPRIDQLDPIGVVAGDTLTIRGAGFDPYNSDNNVIYFTRLDTNDNPVTDYRAWHFSVPDEKTIRVQVPAGFYPGPMKVCVSGYCSNTNMEVDFPVSLTIISPPDGATLNGVVAVHAMVLDPPDPFPACTARLLVDGALREQMPAASPDFSLALDTTTLAAGAHTLKVELDINGGTISASVRVIVRNVPASSLTITSPGSGSTVSGLVSVNAALLNPPVPFPQSEARLLVDGSTLNQKQVTSPSFIFSLDTTTLSLGVHTIGVELLTPTESYSASTNVTVQAAPGGTTVINVGGVGCETKDFVVKFRNSTSDPFPIGKSQFDAIINFENCNCSPPDPFWAQPGRCDISILIAKQDASGNIIPLEGCQYVSYNDQDYPMHVYILGSQFDPAIAMDSRQGDWYRSGAFWHPMYVYQATHLRFRISGGRPHCPW